EGEATVLQGRRIGQHVSYRARLVVDATGPRGALSRLLELPEGSFPEFPPTRALFTHFTGVSRFAECGMRNAECGMPNGPGLFRIPHSAFRIPEAAPYPPDDAALHHIFDGG